MKQFYWHDVEKLPRDGSVALLDVRTKTEITRGMIDGFINIPLDTLRDNLYKIPAEFFFTMFFVMLWNTYLVFVGERSLGQKIKLLWTFKVPWHWAYHGTVFSDGVAQFAFGFYSIMLTSTILGFITMILFKPRSWCVYCPMGTMTQLICKVKNVTKSQNSSE